MSKFDEWNARYHVQKLLGSPESIAYDGAIVEARKEGWDAALKSGEQADTAGLDGQYVVCNECAKKVPLSMAKTYLDKADEGS